MKIEQESQQFIIRNEDFMLQEDICIQFIMKKKTKLFQILSVNFFF